MVCYPANKEERMPTDRFLPEVVKHLKWYVYRLIDPRNGETFYVGKGRGDRIFQHAKGAPAVGQDEGAEDIIDLKLQRIKEISAAGLEIGHVIHRHGIESEKLAFQIEAALIDAYPGLANRVSGHGADDYGVRHVEEIVKEYAAPTFKPGESLILICIARSYQEGTKSVYDAVRGVWRIKASRVKIFKLVLAHYRGLVVGAFRPKEWLPATKANFPWLDDDIQGRIGFVGEPAEQEVASLYVGKRVPDQYRSYGFPVKFVELTASEK
jgi:hypothetical protein